MQNAECRTQNEDAARENAVVDKSFEFAVRIVNLYKYLIHEHKEYTLSRQLLRSGTSIGANVAEAQRGQSKADFTAKMNIALKEANETHYWLKLLCRTEYLSRRQYESLRADVQELLGILMSICKTAGTSK